MKKRLALVPVCAMALLAGACRPRTETKIIKVPVPESPIIDGNLPIDFKKQTYGTPLPINLADPSCAGSSEAQPLQSAAVQGAFYSYQDTDEQTIAITTRILDPRTFERELTNKTDMRYTVQSEKKELTLCSLNPMPGSLEAAALQLKTAADRSWDFYQLVRAASPTLKLPDLPRLGIGLFPQYKKDVKRIEQVIKADATKTQTATQTVTIQTDNAFYSPFADDTLSGSIFAISIIPQSAEARQQGLFNGKGLWEFPVVFHHEFGHHIFQMLFGDSTVLSFRQYQDYWHTHRSLHAIHGVLDADDRSGNPEAQKQRQAFLSSPGYIFSALNEGFADLFAHYSLNEARGLFDISCFRQTRDVQNPLMYGGLPKVWNDELWKETFDISTRLGADAINKSDQTPLELCSLPSFDDIHVVGAVVAHTVDAILQTTVSARPEGTTATLYKAGLLMQWIQNLRASDEVLELSSKQTLSRILNAALGTALTALGDHDKQNFCSVANSKFPAALKRWKDKPAEDAAGVLSACQPE